jgi:[ribosomal protein S5]-alanine N-acetyltransferase
MQPPTLRTERLVLRPLSLPDIPAVTRLASAREVAATTLRIPHPYTEDDARQFISALPAEADAGRAFVFAITAGNEFCGAVGLHVETQHRHAELGYWIGVPFWGRGYATEAARAVVAFGFETLKLERIFAHHFATNPASGRVLQKIGMQREGRLRHHFLKWDQFVDAEMYAILRSDFGKQG